MNISAEIAIYCLFPFIMGILGLVYKLINKQFDILQRQIEQRREIKDCEYLRLLSKANLPHDIENELKEKLNS